VAHVSRCGKHCCAGIARCKGPASDRQLSKQRPTSHRRRKHALGSGMPVLVPYPQQVCSKTSCGSALCRLFKSTVYDMKIALVCIIAAALVATALSAPIPTLADDEPPAFLDDESDVLLVDEESVNCPANTYKDGTSCNPCPGGGTSKAGSTTVSVCQCPANTYNHQAYVKKTRTHVFSCPSCPKGTTSSAGANNLYDCKSSCAANTYMDNDGKSCKSCPFGSIGSVKVYATSSAGSISVSQCKCPANTYIHTGIHRGETTTCKSCPIGSTSVAASSSFYGCKCPANSYMDLGDFCKACPVGTISTAGTFATSKNPTPCNKK
jgi:hypothetical protein